MKLTALIMAGGRGERFWPKSRKKLPKQFLSLTGDGKTMLQLTVERILPLVDIDGIFIATTNDYKELVRQQLPELPEENILCEPVNRNTAPCIGLGAVHIQKKFGDSIMFVLPSDHLIKFAKQFRQTLMGAAQLAEKGERLVTLGIIPSYPETGYGYINFNPENGDHGAYPVERFVEKPDLESAKKYLETERYLWNSGMFIWKTSSILAKIQRFMPSVYDGLERIRDAIGTDAEHDVLQKEFTAFPNESVDYGIMEKADDIFVQVGAFGWDDVGSWLALERIQPINEFGNVISGSVVTVDTRNSIIQGGEKLIAAVGIEDLIIVDTPDALLVCDKNSAGDIKKALEELRQCHRTEYL